MGLRRGSRGWERSGCLGRRRKDEPGKLGGMNVIMDWDGIT